LVQTATAKYAIIVAGGKGLRMNQPLPKQFTNLCGKPLLMHTMQAFAKINGLEIILVLPENHIPFWKQLCIDNNFLTPHKLVAGGPTRADSVINGLNYIETNNALVAIHDGVRPLITTQIIENAFNEAQEKGNAIAAVKLKDSIRQVTGQGNKHVNRDEFYLIQTPQTFWVNEIKHAYATQNPAGFTDDAGIFEATGKHIHLIEGSYSNIKITTPEDLIIAEALLQSK
jgi:2-C-methyl-D-erythritol 4-phosphate cytidylyltransferase